MQINFVVPGFSKCGTTTLCDMLNSHPDVFVPPAKEPGYFAENFHRGWEWYLESFQTRRDEKLLGDGSTTYSSQEFAVSARDRILALSPDCRFIFIARNPKKRLESSFREMHASGYKYGVTPDFKFANCLQQLPNMIADSLYWKLINIFRERIDDDKIHVLFLEDLNQSPQQEFEQCLEFLELPRRSLANESRQLNSANTKTCDTRLLRYIRTNRLTAKWWNRIPLKQQEILMHRLGLRRRFDAEIQWEGFAQEVFESVVVPDTRQFLQHYGKPASFWDLESRPCRTRAA